MKGSGDVRELVRRRAHGACEYCRLPEDVSILSHQIDHIIGKQHRGLDDIENLCLCCIRCNQKKGPNIASIDPKSHIVVALFHPRRQLWREHFSALSNGIVEGLTAGGRATVELLEMNDEERVRLRGLLLERGLWP